jgi:hypothetical protein
MIRGGYFILGALVGITANAAPVTFQSAERQAALVELYTSEGCSSCPPAEEWLSRLKSKPGLWSDFVPVAFHVDYWDSLGWRDKWARKEYTERQRDYAAAWSSENIYTPEFAVNGREWRNWLGLRGAPGLAENTAGVLKVTSEDTIQWQVSFSPTAASSTGWEVHAALLVCGVGSEVKAGENEGRHLQHDFAALKLVSTPLTGKKGVLEGEFAMPLGGQNPAGRLALAVWVTRSGSLEPVQATGGWLPASGTSQ